MTDLPDDPFHQPNPYLDVMKEGERLFSALLQYRDITRLAVALEALSLQDLRAVVLRLAVDHGPINVIGPTTTVDDDEPADS